VTDGLTDRQTDRQRDKITIANTRSAVPAVARKKAAYSEQDEMHVKRVYSHVVHIGVPVMVDLGGETKFARILGSRP